MRRVLQEVARIGPSQRVLGLILAIGLADVGLIVALDGGWPALTDVDLGLLALVIAFAVVEWRVIHVQFRAEASSFSLFEVPLVLGLLYSSSAWLLLAAVIGVAIGLFGGRRQPLLKVVFNAVNLGFYTGVAAVVVAHWPHGGVERLIGLSVLAGIVLGSATSFGLIVVAVSLTEGFPGWRKASELLLFGLVVSIANTTIGLTAAIIVARDALGLILLAVPVFLLFSAFRMITSEREQRERIEFLYRSTRRLDIGASESGLATLLQEARVMFRAEIGAVVLHEDEQVRLFHSTSSTERSTILEAPGDEDLATAALAALDEPVMISAQDSGPQADLVAKLGGRDAMLAKLRAEDRDLGTVMIANRLGEVTSFTENDLQVLAALARQSAFLMHSDRLEQALTELRKLERELAYQATHDSLTGLPNRSMFTEALHLAAASATGHAVLFVDLDGFKAVNDRHGHAAGDLVLIEVAKRLTGLVRPVDTVSRFGGDEFAILLLDNTAPQSVADRIVESLSEPIDVQERTVEIGCSVGLVVGNGERDPEVLLRDADAAMYRAKQSGKGTVVRHHADDWSASIAATGALGDAIGRNELEVHYQPIVDIDRRRVAGVEALVRWRSPDRGLLLPGDFLGEAERSGLIGRIDSWVLRRASADLADIWALDSDLFVSVNLSPQHLLDGTAADLLAGSELDEARGRLVIEWSEAALIAEPDQSAAAIAAVKAAGATVALDRFGDGQASLAYLQRFDIDLLKLNRSIIEQLTGADGRTEMVEGLIQIAHSLGLRVIAEGIEDPGQLDALARTRCDLAQGFLFARPTRLEELRPLLTGAIGAPPQPATATATRLT